ncbi:hypothetical protein P43SY_001918 [Pythium insidiosum]|uniref:Uncharacterized protein n=1 Tax=Pythium insidiosum TaxID=114742 RepID=A0AAD5LEM5_PYTIN|nr:hypothetical protein P43SY_001918 [Pythium insidiosum]
MIEPGVFLYLREGTTAAYSVRTLGASGNTLETSSGIAGSAITRTAFADATLAASTANAGAESTFTVSFTSAARVPVGGRIELDFPVVAPSFFVLPTAVVTSLVNVDATSTTISISGTSLRLTIAGQAIAIGAAVSVTFGKIYNPAQQTIGTFTIRTRHSAGSTLQESTGVAGPVITKTTLPLATTTIVPGSLMGGMVTSLVVSFANDAFLAVGSKIIVTVPARFRITDSSLGSLTGIPATGTTAVVTSATTIELTLASNTMSPGTGRSFTMANVYNPGSSCDQYIYEYCTTPWEAYSIQIVDSAGNIYQENTAVTGTPILKKPRLSGWIVMD